MRKSAFLAILISIAVILNFTACDNFFSNSMGSPRRYNKANINVNAGNAGQWIERAAGNPDLALAVLESIMDQIGSANPSDKAVLKQAGVMLAVEASGLGTSILSNANALSNLISGEGSNEDAIKELVGKLQGDFNSGHGPNSANMLAQILNPTSGSSAPQFDNNYMQNAQPSEVAQAIIILSLGIMNDIGKTASDDFSNLINDIEGIQLQNGKVTLTNAASPPEPKVLALVAYLNLIAGNEDWDNPITNGIKDALLSE